MWSIFKPLFTYRKYLLAHKVLNESVKAFFLLQGVSDDDGKIITPMHQKGYMLQLTKYYLNFHKKINPERLHEVLDLLKSNDHIELYTDQDVYKITYRATIKGDRANNEGFYMTKVYKSIITIYGSTAGIVTLLITYLPKLIRYLS